MPHRILLLDDEPKIVELLRRSLAREGYDVLCEGNPAAALERLKEQPVDILLTDLKMPGMDGLEVLRRAKAIRPDLEVVIMTAYATVETAKEALKRGAIDYLVKPFSADDDLKPLIRKVLDAGELAEDATNGPRKATAGSATAPAHAGTGPSVATPQDQPASAPEAPSADGPLARIVTASPAMKKILDRLPRIAASNVSVLLRGESGTGKEVVADAIHALSPRRGKPFVKINCGALPETLLEAELFGHVKGAFTGAVADREGLFEAADGGSIFLDEIGEVSPALQVKLLRILQEGEFQRVGESRTRKTNARVVAATNRNLEAMMRQGTFRQDLYYRLNVVPIVLPPLRERREDIPTLVEHFQRRLHPGTKVEFHEDAHRALLEYDWPGNIRELENAVEHALVLGDPSRILPEDLPVAVQDYQALRARKGADAPGTLGSGGMQDAPGNRPQGESGGGGAVGTVGGSEAGDGISSGGIGGGGGGIGGGATLEDIERHCLLAALRKTDFNQTRAARLLGITRRTLGYRLRKYELEDEIERLREEN